MESVADILDKKILDRKDLISLLMAEGEEAELLFRKARSVKQEFIGNKVWFRGLVELSNICEKDCLYCGIRQSNREVKRYNLSDGEVLDAAKFAFESRYGSIVLQAGEIEHAAFANRIERLVREIKDLSDGKLGITLSLGEQSTEVYQQWFEAGAHRYLLRIESSNPVLYKAIHPTDGRHLYERRMQCLNSLKSIGYQVGTGVMIGLPEQTITDLANDLLFFKKFDIDMVGMGPYIEHENTPLFTKRDLLMPLDQRFKMSLKMIAVLRILMCDINIAAATALQAIDPLGREKAVKIGANIIMPNITPGLYRNDYALYQNKPCVDEEPSQCKGCLDARIALADNEIAYDEWGDSKHFTLRFHQNRK